MPTPIPIALVTSTNSYYTFSGSKVCNDDLNATYAKGGPKYVIVDNKYPSLKDLKANKVSNPRAIAIKPEPKKRGRKPKSDSSEKKN